MNLEQHMQDLVAFLRANQGWAPAIVYAIAFGECMAFLSWLVPATFFFSALAAVAGGSGMNLFPMALAASVGAGSGFWVSYWIGLAVGPKAGDYWPLSRNPALLERAHTFFEKWGMLGVAGGHFLGPLRGVIAIVAGMVKMPFLPFQAANWLASFAWGFGLFYLGGEAGKVIKQLYEGFSRWLPG